MGGEGGGGDRVEEEVWFNSVVLGGCLRGRRGGK